MSETATNGLRIIRLEANDVLRLTAVEIDPKGNLVCVGGENSAGKSSVLNCIEMALAGGASIPPQPIHAGSTRGGIKIDLGDLVVERTFTAKGSALSVKSRDGAKYPSPQSILDSLVGQLSFDPLRFRNMKPGDQREALRELIGIDFSEIDKRRQEAFDRRTVVNRLLKEAQAQLKGHAPRHDGVPDSEVSVSDASRAVEAALLQKRQNDDKRLELEDLNLKISGLEQEIASLEARISELKSALTAAHEASLALASEVDTLADPDIDSARRSLFECEAINKKVRENASRAAQEKLVESRSAEADQLTEEIMRADAEKAALIGAAKMPVPGLGFGDLGVTYNGVPYEQSGMAESIRVSVAMAAAANPKLRVILVRDGSLLSEKNLHLLAEIAAELGLQVWVERVGEGRECQVVMEDGHVKEVRPLENGHGTHAEPAALATRQ